MKSPDLFVLLSLSIQVDSEATELHFLDLGLLDLSELEVEYI
jgi:hypothetical protein